MKKFNNFLLTSLCILMFSGCQNAQTETTTYRFSSFYKWFLGQPSYESILSYEGDDAYTIDQKYGEEVSIEGDYLLLQATDEQRDALIDQNEKLLQEVIESSSFLNSDLVSYDGNYQTVRIYLEEDAVEQFTSFEHFLSSSSINFGSDLFGILNIALANRILLTADSDVGLSVEVINQKSDHLLTKAYYPYQQVSITDQDWQTSKEQDVLVSFEKTDYQTITATIEKIEDHRIIFTLPDERELYLEDEEVELCLDSVYAEDVYLAYQLKEGDSVILEVDGLYALHEDGDAIADIAPLSIIPIQYAEE